MFKLLKSKRRCIGKTQNGTRCRNRMVKTNKCWIHFAYQDNLRIKPSTIANARLGLFSYKLPFKQYHKLGKYKGYTPPNAICKGTKDTDRCIDTNWSTDGALRYANDIGIQNIAPKSVQKFIPVGEMIKQIKPHAELFNFYGKHYWLNHKNWNYKNNYPKRTVFTSPTKSGTKYITKIHVIKLINTIIVII